MKYKTTSGYLIKSGMTCLLLASLCGLASAANIAYVPKAAPGDTATAGAGKQWPNTRFVVNGDCITDNLTGLMWAKNANLIGQKKWFDSTTTTYPAQEAISVMNGKNSIAIGYHLCGYSDWRLPNVNELLSLVNYAATQSGSTPAAWLNNPTQGFTNVQAFFYWSSTARNGSNAWRVNFTDGSSNSISSGNDNYVWPVRSGK